MAPWMGIVSVAMWDISMAVKLADCVEDSEGSPMGAVMVAPMVVNLAVETGCEKGWRLAY
jgi:hypothetical protein